MSLPSIKVKLLDENETKEEIIKELDAPTGNRTDRLEPLEEISLETLDMNPKPKTGLEPLEEISLETLDMNPKPKTGLEPLEEISLETVDMNPKPKTELEPLEEISLETVDMNPKPKTELEPLEEISLETMDVVPHENIAEDNLLEEVELNNIIEPVDDIKDLLGGVEINNNEEDDEVDDEVISFDNVDNEDNEDNVEDTKTDFISLLDSNIDNSKNIQSGGGISGIKGDYFEDDNYIEYLENYGLFLKEKNQKGNQSKFSYEDKGGVIIKTSLKTGNKTTIILPEYKNVEDILHYIDIEINKIVYLLKKKRDDILGNNISKDNFDKFKTKYLGLLNYKKGCLKFINYSESKIIENEIILRKKIEMKHKLFIITEKLKHINSTTKNKEETNKLIKEYIEENQILSLEKKIRENNNSNMFWNDSDNNPIDLKYDKFLIKEPSVKKEISAPLGSTNKNPKKLKIKRKEAKKEGKEKKVEAKKEGKEKKVEAKKEGKEKKVEAKEKKVEAKKEGKETSQPKKLKLKIKYTPQINTSDPSYGEDGWEGPFKETDLQSGKASIIKTPGLKIKTIEEAKDTCQNTEECKGITEDTSRKNKKITLRKTDIFKPSENRRSWVKK
jgi:hypothetical protein